MLIVILGIILIVLSSGYKKNPQPQKRKPILVINVIVTILNVFSLIGMVFTLALFDQLMNVILDICYEAFDFDKYTLYSMAEILNITIWMSVVMSAIMLVFGIIAMIIGYAALAKNKSNIPAANVQGYIPAGTQPQPQQYQQSAYAQQQSAYTAQQTPDSAQQPCYEWYCSCGNSNPASVAFCPKCGAKNPNT